MIKSRQNSLIIDDAVQGGYATGAYKWENKQTIMNHSLQWQDADNGACSISDLAFYIA